MAVYYSMVGGRWLIPTALSLLLMFAGMGLAATRGVKGKSRASPPAAFSSVFPLS